MMETTNIRYTAADNSEVRVEPQGWNCPQPCYTHHQATITQWEEGKSDLWVQQEAEYNAYQNIINYNPESGNPPPTEGYTICVEV